MMCEALIRRCDRIARQPATPIAPPRRKRDHAVEVSEIEPAPLEPGGILHFLAYLRTGAPSSMLGPIVRRSTQ